MDAPERHLSTKGEDPPRAIGRVSYASLSLEAPMLGSSFTDEGDFDAALMSAVYSCY